MYRFIRRPPQSRMPLHQIVLAFHDGAGCHFHSIARRPAGHSHRADACYAWPGGLRGALHNQRRVYRILTCFSPHFSLYPFPAYRRYRHRPALKWRNSPAHILRSRSTSLWPAIASNNARQLLSRRGGPAAFLQSVRHGHDGNANARMQHPHLSSTFLSFLFARIMH